MTTWQDQRDTLLDAVSKQHAEPEKRLFIALRDKALVELVAERKTKRQVLDALRRVYEKRRAHYLRIPGTTYEGWLQHGPQLAWDEVIAAAADDAAWDRLVERCTRDVKPRRRSR